MTAKELVAEAHRNREPGATPRLVDGEYLRTVLTMILDLVLNDNGQCEREPSSGRAVVARAIAALIATVEDSDTVCVH